MSREDKGKLFVGGLSWNTTQASLLAYFSRYGEVTDCVVVMNPTTGKSRGFGFVNFKDPSCVDTVMAAGPHVLDGKQIDPNGCNRKKINKAGGKENSRKKLFVGGLPPSVDEQQLRDGFSKYGKVNDVVIVYDQQKQKPRGFGFLTFEEEESVEKVVQERFIQIAGKQVECKRAEPKDTSMASMGHSLIDPTGAAGTMVLAQGPDGTVSLVPAHALVAAATSGGHSAGLMLPQAAPAGLMSSMDVAAYRAAAAAGVPAELLQAGAMQQAGLRLLPSGYSAGAATGSIPGSQYIMMGGGAVSAAAAAGGGYVMMSNPAMAASGGGNVLVPSGSMLVSRSGLSGTAAAGMMYQTAGSAGAGMVVSGTGAGYLLSAGGAMPQFMMGYPTSANAAGLQLAGSAAESANNPYTYQVPSGAVYAIGKADQTQSLVGSLSQVADTATEKSVAAAAAAAASSQLASQYGLGLVGADSSEESSVRAANGTSDSQAVAAAQMLAGTANSRFGYYLVPGPGGTAMYAAAGDPSTQAAYFAAATAQPSTLISRVPVSSHSYHPYRR